ncbi:hypothetical protein [Mesorhizobium sp.]|uniref:hypothetical protein n=1 Tax=Mesorhizobium sp. TaxID=1871066 RepID=UPI0025F55DAC|nr:hypothetical protein [Mesorhizobium sp.]
MPTLFAALCFALLFLVLRFTVFGRGLYLIKPSRAMAAGVRTGRVVAIDYLFCSLLAATGVWNLLSKCVRFIALAMIARHSAAMATFSARPEPPQ